MNNRSSPPKSSGYRTAVLLMGPIAVLFIAWLLFLASPQSNTAQSNPSPSSYPSTLPPGTSSDSTPTLPPSPPQTPLISQLTTLHPSFTPLAVPTRVRPYPRGPNGERQFAEATTSQMPDSARSAPPVTLALSPQDGRTTLLPEETDLHTLSARRMVLDLAALETVAAAKNARILAPLPDGSALNLVIHSIKNRAGRTHTLQGEVEGEPQKSVVQLVLHDGILHGTIARYHIDQHIEYRILSSGYLMVRELDPRTMTADCTSPNVGDETATSPDSEPLTAPQQPSPIQSQPSLNSPTNVTIDIVVGFDRAARIADGGHSQIEARIIASVDLMNAAFVNSQVTATELRLLGTVEDPLYVFPGRTPGTMGSSDELGDLNNSSPTNPALNTVSTYANTLGADLRAFIVKQTDGSAGVAFRPGVSSITARDYMTPSRITFAHEIGHNIGARHSWGDTSTTDAVTTDFAYCWRLAPSNHPRVRTIMAYDWNWGSGTRIPYFANPNVLYQGTRTGQVDGYNATEDPFSDPRYISGGYVGGLGSGFDGTNPSLGARNAHFLLARAPNRASLSTRAALQIVTPAPSVNWTIGEPYEIFWTGGDHTDSASLSLYKAGVFQSQITSALPAHRRRFLWTPSLSLPSGSDYMVRVTLNDTLFADSANFTLFTPSFAISPLSPLSPPTASGDQGGPFSPTRATYTLSNTSTSSFNWTATSNVPWLTISANSGTLLPAETSPLTASLLTTPAATLPVGQHIATLTFTDLTNNNTITRTFILNVIGYPQISVESPEGTPLASGSSPVAYRTVLLNSQSSRRFFIRNLGNESLNLGTPFLTGPNSADFAVTSLSNDSLLPGELAALSVTFNPSAVGSYSATLSIPSNDTHPSPFLIPLIGTGTRLSGSVDLVSDLNRIPAGISPANLLVMDGYCLFSASTPQNGTELWRSDGTAAGTFLLLDINPGTGSASPTNLTRLGNIAYFSASNSLSGTELWRSDGTAAGTQMVRDINPGSSASAPTNLIAISSTLYFSAIHPDSGRELWKSDGTAAGTQLVADISVDNTSSNPSSLTEFQGNLIFAATTDGFDTNFYRSNGTSSGTTPFLFTRQIPSATSPPNISVIGNLIFLTANDGNTGLELWRSDGTLSGTRLIEDINFGFSSSNPANLTVLNNILYFRATTPSTGTELWRSDGTSIGTYMVIDTFPGSSSGLPGNPVVYNNQLFYSASNGITGFELWSSDGTALGTRLISDIYSDANSSSPTNFRESNGQLYFTAIDDETGRELWKTDGTPSNTVRVKDINPGTTSSSPINLQNLAGTLIFACNDGDIGLELWRSDGTPSGTFPIDDKLPGSASSSPTQLANINGTLYFSASNGTQGSEPWSTKATPASTALVRDISSGSLSSSPTGFILSPNNSHALFSASNGTANGIELWTSDGTPVGTTLLKDINLGSTSASPANFCRTGNLVFFTATTSTSGTELWCTDGTTDGTRLVRDIIPGTSSSSPSQLTAYNGLLYFHATDTVSGTELWRSDGTQTGTYLLKDIRPGPFNSTPQNFAILDGLLYFSAYTENDGYELWRTDGTASGTIQVASIYPGLPGSDPSNLTPIGSTLFFSATTASSGIELWKYDTTTLTASLVLDINPGTSFSSPSQLTAHKNRLLFTAFDPSNGRELWITDGTPSGTTLLKDIRPGTPSSTPFSLTSVNDTVCFSANDGTTGTELWQTDGTPQNTVLLSDLNPGPSSSSPISLTPIGPRLYFTATLPSIGTELLTLELRNPAPLLQVFSAAAPSPPLLPNSTPVNFGSALLGQRQAKTFAIRNLGNRPLSIARLQTLGDWQIGTPRTNTLLPPQGQTILTAYFAPTKPGPQIGGLTIQSDDPTHPFFTIACTGAGIDSPVGLPVITLPPAHQILRPGARLNLFTFAVGTPPLAYQWHKNGRTMPGQTSSLLSIPSVSPTTAGLYTISVSSKQRVTSPTTFVTIVPDTPQSHIIQAKKSITFTSGDSGPTTSRIWTHNGTPVPASPRFSLKQNGQSLTIKNLQPSDAGVYHCNVTNPAGTLPSGAITLAIITGPPRITPPLNIPNGIVGAPFSYQIPIDTNPLNQPTTYQARGLPPGLSMDPKTGAISGYPTLAGNYQTSMTAANNLGAANATPSIRINPLPDRIAGSYTGLVSRHPTLNGNLGGKFDFTITESSSLSGSLELGSTKIPFKGRVMIDGNGTLSPQISIPITLPNDPATPSTLTFTLLPAQGTIAPGGTFSNASSSTPVEGWRQTWHPSTIPASPLSAYYTFILKPSAIDQGNITIPQGDTFGSFTITPSGTFRMTTRLADGTPLTLASFVGPNGQIALFNALYSKNLPGSLHGRQTINLGINLESSSDNTLTGNAVTWSRPPLPGTLYPEGFTPRSLDTFGGAYFAPPNFLNVSPSFGGRAQLQFLHAQSASQPNRTLFIYANNLIFLSSSTTPGATTTFNPIRSTGAFSGAFTLIDPHWQSPPPATWRRTSTYQGITIKNGNTYSGHGHFLLPQLPTSNPKTSPPLTLSGQVQLQTVP